MKISHQEKTIIKKNGTLSVSLLTPDLTSIFKRDWFEKDYDAMIYIYCHNDKIRTNLGGQLYVEGTPYYIGFAKFGDWNSIEKVEQLHIKVIY